MREEGREGDPKVGSQLMSEILKNALIAKLS